MTNAIEKIEARRAIVAKTYASLMAWAITVEIVPSGTSLDIADYYSLPRDVFAAAAGTGLPSVVAEYRGLSDALEIING